MGKNKILVIGGGLGGLMTTIKLAEAGLSVDLFSLVPCKRSHSVCAQGGINASVNTKGEGDSPQIHFEETILGGDFLANQPMVLEMCQNAPGFVYMLDRMGVQFNRTPEGLIDFRRFGGTQFHRTAFAGSTTGQQMLYALDEQARRYEVEGLVTRYEGWEFLSAVIDGRGVARGIVAQNLTTFEIRAFRGDAVVMATGGCGMIFGRSTMSAISTGAAAASLYRQGAWYANGEFIQVHPTAVAGEDKNRLISEAVRGEGGRLWTYKDGQRWYFLEEWYPKYKNLVPRDIASRAIFKAVREMGLGVDGKDVVYLDISHVDRKTLQEKLGGILEIYEKFMNEDPSKVPMRVFPSVHYSMGGLYIDSRQMTNIPGILAAGECEYQYHGANRLGANSLLSCLQGGFAAARTAGQYARGLDQAAADVKASIFEDRVREETSRRSEILKMNGKENLYQLWQELGEVMTTNVTVVRHNKNLAAADEKIQDIARRARDINVGDLSTWANQTAVFARQFFPMLDIARVITLGALARNESRGGHYKPEFPDRDDANWLKTTVAKYTPNGPELSYEAVDTSLLKPRERKY